MQLSPEEITSVKDSYIQILKLFLSKEMVETKYITCLLKWGVHLNVNVQDIKTYESIAMRKEFTDTTDKARSLYNLVYMIYLDDVVEDVELEIAILYARELGIDTSLVGDFFKAIATAPFDGRNAHDVRDEIRDYLKLYGMIDD